MDLVSAIRKRHSVRRFNKNPLPKEVIDQVVTAGRRATALYPKIGIRWFVAWEGSIVARSLGGIAGVYGMLTTAPHFIVAVSEEHPGYMENLGFRMEQMILTATTLGLGTCWIGGLFREQRLSQSVPDLYENERIVALTPLGYEDDTQGTRMAQQLIHWGTERLGKRKPLSEIASQHIWSVSWTGEDKTMDQILERIRFAPSWANTQPWHFCVDDHQVIATVDHTPKRGNVREGKPYYLLDGGIAMCHFYLSARAAGWPGEWRIPEGAERKMIRDRYAIPKNYDILGIFPRAHSNSDAAAREG